MVEYIIIVIVIGVFCIGIFMAMGKSVQAQTAISTQKMVGSVAHDDALVAMDVQGRVMMEKTRQNLMTHN
jgi:hypothetical protein